VGIAFDADAGTLTFYKNGVSQGQAYSGITGQGPYYPAVSCYASTSYNNFGTVSFKYPVPAGHKPFAQARSVTKLNSPSSGSSYGLINVNSSGTVAFTAGKTYTFSIFAKAAEWTRLGIRLYDGVAAYFIRTTVDLSTGTQVSAPGNEVGTTVVTPYGNGWYRVSVTGLCANTGSNAVCVECHNTSTVQNTETCNGSGIYIYNAQYEEATSAGVPVISKTNASPIPVSLGAYRYHAYTTVGASGFTPSHTGTVEVLVVAGGGGGGGVGASQGGGGGGGGAGGVIFNATYAVTAGQTYPVFVGTGGVGGATSGDGRGGVGQNSQFGTLIAIGGGGGSDSDRGRYAYTGGSGGGGGGGGGVSSNIVQGAPGVFGQGNMGGNGYIGGQGYGSGGGGGAGYVLRNEPQITPFNGGKQGGDGGITSGDTGEQGVYPLFGSSPSNPPGLCGGGGGGNQSNGGRGGGGPTGNYLIGAAGTKLSGGQGSVRLENVHNGPLGYGGGGGGGLYGGGGGAWLGAGGGGSSTIVAGKEKYEFKNNITENGDEAFKRIFKIVKNK
jgi:hypothetical protein